MSLDRYFTLGRSGLRVSRLSLGAMTFGEDWGWGAAQDTARAMFDRYLDAGGNFIDTSDMYTGGSSETMLGRFIEEAGARDRVVLATKFSYNAQPGNPNAGGNGRKNILRALEGSLRRLRTDYIDLYCCTPGIASRRRKKWCARWTTWCAQARSAMPVCPTCPRGTPRGRRLLPRHMRCRRC